MVYLPLLGGSFRVNNATKRPASVYEPTSLSVAAILLSKFA